MDHSEIKHLPKTDHTPAKLDDASKLLLKAASAIETYGHVKGDLGHPSKGFCFLGALTFAEHGSADAIINGKGWNKSMSAAQQRFCRNLGGQSEVDWNNAPHRTKDEVVAKMRAVALSA